MTDLVQAGQRYRGIMTGAIVTVKAAGSRPEYSICDADDGRKDIHVAIGNGLWERIDVPAAAPLAADRTGCKAWCGMRQDVSRDHGRMAGEGIPDSPGKKGEADLWWCSKACKTARLPPLAVQSAEAKPTIAMDMAVPGSERSFHRCSGCKWFIDTTNMFEGDVTRLVHEHIVKDHRAQPAPQPAPAKGPRLHAPPCYCADCGDTKPSEQPKPAQCEGGVVEPCESIEWVVRIIGKTGYRVRLCESCYLGSEDMRYRATPATGTPYTGPERIERPKLAHSAMWADEAEDVR